MSLVATFEPLLRALFPDAVATGASAWSVALRNGHRHDVRVECGAGGRVGLSTPLPLDAYTPNHLAQLNPGLPRGSRIVCANGAPRLIAELAPGAALPSALTRGLDHFQRSLDILSGVSAAGPEDAAPTLAVGSSEWEDDWDAEVEPNGEASVKLPHRSLALTARVSPQGCCVGLFGPVAAAPAVRDAVAELLLRVSSQVNFVRVCASLDGAMLWSARLDVPSGLCSTGEALAALALVCRQSAAEVRALGDEQLAGRYRAFSSIWPVPSGQFPLAALSGLPLGGPLSTKGSK
jgi:hypothetical protein